MCILCVYSQTVSVCNFMCCFIATDVCSVTTVKPKKKSKYLKRGLSLITKKYKPSVRKYLTDAL